MLSDQMAVSVSCTVSMMRIVEPNRGRFIGDPDGIVQGFGY